MRETLNVKLLFFSYEAKAVVSIYYDKRTLFIVRLSGLKVECVFDP